MGEEQEPHGVAVISYKKHAQILREYLQQIYNDPIMDPNKNYIKKIEMIGNSHKFSSQGTSIKH